MAIQQCPRCGSGVGGGATSCNICGTKFDEAPGNVVAGSAPAASLPNIQPDGPVPGIPGLPLQSEAAPNYLSPGTSLGTTGGGGEVRVSLTGEAMEVAAPSARGSGPGGYGPPAGSAAAARPGTRSGPSMPSAPTRAGMAVPRSEKKSSAGAVVGVIIVLLLAAGGAGGWWWYQKQHSPAMAAEKLLSTLKAKDFKTAVGMMYISPEMDSQLAMVGGKDALPGLLEKNQGTIKEYKIGEATVTGESASVSATVTADSPITGATATETTSFPFVLKDGTWKLDIAAQAKQTFGGAGGGQNFGSSSGGGGRGRGRRR